MEPEKLDTNWRNPDGTLKAGHPPMGGRPKGLTIKERVRQWLEEHPDSMEDFVKHFVEKNRDLAWQMLEGRPSQGIGTPDDMGPLQVQLIVYGDHNDSA